MRLLNGRVVVEFYEEKGEESYYRNKNNYYLQNLLLKTNLRIAQIYCGFPLNMIIMPVSKIIQFCITF